MSQTTTYVPQAGTIPAKVIAHLQTLPPGAELSTAMVLEAIGQPRDWHGLTSCMKTAVEHGVVSKRQDRAGWLMWSLLDRSTMVTAKPAPLADHTAIDDIEPENRPRRIQEHAKRLDKAEQALRTVEDAAAELDLLDVVDAEFVEVAISNTGRLLISTGIQQIALSPEQTKKVFQYLDEQRGVEWEAAA